MPGPVSSAVAILVASNHKILGVLPEAHLLRPKKQGAGMTKGRAKPWDVPGGKLKPSETPVDAAVRELREETRLTVDPTACAGTGYIPDCKCAVFGTATRARAPRGPIWGCFLKKVYVAVTSGRISHGCLAGAQWTALGGVGRC
eukprot:COSAG01_NODE_21265_length_910_cov_2.157830_2_plen_143_part_01